MKTGEMSLPEFVKELIKESMEIEWRRAVATKARQAMSCCEAHSRLDHIEEMWERWGRTGIGKFELLEELGVVLEREPDTRTAPESPCTCAEIQRKDPLRHFRECPLREDLPAGHPQAEYRGARCWSCTHPLEEIDGVTDCRACRSGEGKPAPFAWLWDQRRRADKLLAVLTEIGHSNPAKVVWEIMREEAP